MWRSSVCIRSDPVALVVPLDQTSSKDPLISPFRGDSKRGHSSDLTSSHWKPDDPRDRVGGYPYDGVFAGIIVFAY